MQEIAIASIAAAALLIIEHYIPYRAWLRRELPKLASYTIGVLALNIPLTVLFVYWGLMQAVAALWCVTCAGGLVVILAYSLDHYQNTSADQRDAEEIERVKRGRA